MSLLARTIGAVARDVEAWFFAPSDPRAYAALRIGYAVSALAVLVDLWPVRYTLFASSGMFGGAIRQGGLPIFDMFAFGSSEAAVTTLFVVVAAALMALALGIYPRATAWIAYAWAASYTAAAPLSQAGFDVILRVIGFALAVSPTVSTWSVGSRRVRPPPPAYGLRLVQWQVMLIYVTTAWLKAPDPFWRNGDAIPYFWMSMFSRLPSPAYAHLPVLGALATFGTLIVEATLPFLLWIRKTRFLGLFLGVALHFGIAVTSKIALFSLCIVSLYPAFLEHDDFERVAVWFGRRSSSA